MNRVVDIDHGWRDLRRALLDVPEMRVVVGIREAAGAYDATDETGRPATVAQVATFNEFGLGVPERSWLRSSWDENIADVERMAAKELQLVVSGEQSLPRALGRLGLRVSSDAQRKIVTLKEPSNAPRTIAKKKSSNPLIDTGQMRQSVGHEVRPGARETGTVGSP